MGTKNGKPLFFNGMIWGDFTLLFSETTQTFFFALGICFEFWVLVGANLGQDQVLFLSRKEVPASRWLFFVKISILFGGEKKPSYFQLALFKKNGTEIPMGNFQVAVTYFMSND